MLITNAGVLSINLDKLQTPITLDSVLVSLDKDYQEQIIEARKGWMGLLALGYKVHENPLL